MEYFSLLEARGKARIFPIVGIKGYASVFEVSSHEELLKLLNGNPMAPIETYTIHPLSEFPPASIAKVA